VRTNIDDLKQQSMKTNLEERKASFENMDPKAKEKYINCAKEMIRRFFVVEKK
jgi:hypothetical protein